MIEAIGYWCAIAGGVIVACFLTWGAWEAVHFCLWHGILRHIMLKEKHLQGWYSPWSRETERKGASVELYCWGFPFGRGMIGWVRHKFVNHKTEEPHAKR